ncbi:hypothetical protein [Nocardioides sp.]|uniref:hypothetical protein n=1 Tax=Nocardioides sp. TaxID=35761 RepID=UPI00356326A1
MASYLRVDGLSRVVRDLQAIGVDAEDLRRAFSSIASEGASLVSSLAPRRTGRLARDTRGNRAKNRAVVTVGRASIPYAGPINYGWPARNITAAGFLQKADQSWQPYALRRLEQELNTIIRRKGLS